MVKLTEAEIDELASDLQESYPEIEDLITEDMIQSAAIERDSYSAVRELLDVWLAETLREVECESAEAAWFEMAAYGPRD